MPVKRKRQTTVIQARPYPQLTEEPPCLQDGGGATVGHELARRARMAGAYTVGDQMPPAVILWPDGERRWSPVLDDLKLLLPELYVLGDMAWQAAEPWV